MSEVSSSTNQMPTVGGGGSIDLERNNYSSNQPQQHATRIVNRNSGSSPPSVQRKKLPVKNSNRTGVSSSASSSAQQGHRSAHKSLLKDFPPGVLDVVEGPAVKVKSTTVVLRWYVPLRTVRTIAEATPGSADARHCSQTIDVGDTPLCLVLGKSQAKAPLTPPTNNPKKGAPQEQQPASKAHLPWCLSVFLQLSRPLVSDVVSASQLETMGQAEREHVRSLWERRVSYSFEFVPTGEGSNYSVSGVSRSTPTNGSSSQGPTKSLSRDDLGKGDGSSDCGSDGAAASSSNNINGGQPLPPSTAGKLQPPPPEGYPPPPPDPILVRNAISRMKVAESSFGDNKRVFGFREFIPFQDIPRNKDIVYYPVADRTENELFRVRMMRPEGDEDETGTSPDLHTNQNKFTSFGSAPVQFIEQDVYLDEDYVIVEAKVNMHHSSERVRRYVTACVATSRQDYNKIGLKNHGATCYINVLLELLFHLSFFRREVYNLHKRNGSGNGKAVFEALQGIFYHLETSTTPVSTMTLLRSYKISPSIQCDAHEFLSEFFLHKILKHITDVFSFKVKYVTQCYDVPYSSSMEEQCFELSVGVGEGCLTLEDAIAKELTAEPLGDLYDTGHKDYGRQKAFRQMCIVSLPCVLFIHIKRFDMYAKKIHASQTFPDTLPLQCGGKTVNFTLHSAVIHHGTSSNSGHYTAFVRTGSLDANVKNRHCYHLDDEFVQEVNESELFKSYTGRHWSTPTSSAYVLCYVREDVFDSCTTNFEPAPREVALRYAAKGTPQHAQLTKKKSGPSLYDQHRAQVLQSGDGGMQALIRILAHRRGGLAHLHRWLVHSCNAMSPLSLEELEARRELLKVAALMSPAPDVKQVTGASMPLWLSSSSVLSKSIAEPQQKETQQNDHPDGHVNAVRVTIVTVDHLQMLDARISPHHDLIVPNQLRQFQQAWSFENANSGGTSHGGGGGGGQVSGGAASIRGQAAFTGPHQFPSVPPPNASDSVSPADGNSNSTAATKSGERRPSNVLVELPSHVAPPSGPSQQQQQPDPQLDRDMTSVFNSHEEFTPRSPQSPISPESGPNSSKPQFNSAAAATPPAAATPAVPAAASPVRLHIPNSMIFSPRTPFTESDTDDEDLDEDDDQNGPLGNVGSSPQKANAFSTSGDSSRQGSPAPVLNSGGNSGVLSGNPSFTTSFASAVAAGALPGSGTMAPSQKYDSAGKANHPHALPMLHSEHPTQTHSKAHTHGPLPSFTFMETATIEEVRDVIAQHLAQQRQSSTGGTGLPGATQHPHSFSLNGSLMTPREGGGETTRSSAGTAGNTTVSPFGRKVETSAKPQLFLFGKRRNGTWRPSMPIFDLIENTAPETDVNTSGVSPSVAKTPLRRPLVVENASVLSGLSTLRRRVEMDGIMAKFNVPVPPDGESGDQPVRHRRLSDVLLHHYEHVESKGIASLTLFVSDVIPCTAEDSLHQLARSASFTVSNSAPTSHNMRLQKQASASMNYQLPSACISPMSSAHIAPAPAAITEGARLTSFNLMTTSTPDLTPPGVAIPQAAAKIHISSSDPQSGAAGSGVGASGPLVHDVIAADGENTPSPVSGDDVGVGSGNNSQVCMSKKNSLSYNAPPKSGRRGSDNFSEVSATTPHFSPLSMSAAHSPQQRSFHMMSDAGPPSISHADMQVETNHMPKFKHLPAPGGSATHGGEMASGSANNRARTPWFLLSASVDESVPVTNNNSISSAAGGLGVTDSRNIRKLDSLMAHADHSNDSNVTFGMNSVFTPTAQSPSNAASPLNSGKRNSTSNSAGSWQQQPSGGLRLGGGNRVVELPRTLWAEVAPAGPVEPISLRTAFEEGVHVVFKAFDVTKEMLTPLVAMMVPRLCTIGDVLEFIIKHDIIAPALVLPASVCELVESRFYSAETGGPSPNPRKATEEASAIDSFLRMLLAKTMCVAEDIRPERCSHLDKAATVGECELQHGDILILSVPSHNTLHTIVMENLGTSKNASVNGAPNFSASISAATDAEASVSAGPSPPKQRRSDKQDSNAADAKLALQHTSSSASLVAKPMVVSPAVEISAYQFFTDFAVEALRFQQVAITLLSPCPPTFATSRSPHLPPGTTIMVEVDLLNDTKKSIEAKAVNVCHQLLQREYLKTAERRGNAGRGGGVPNTSFGEGSTQLKARLWSASQDLDTEGLLASPNSLLLGASGNSSSPMTTTTTTTASLKTKIAVGSPFTEEHVNVAVEAIDELSQTVFSTKEDTIGTASCPLTMMCLMFPTEAATLLNWHLYSLDRRALNKVCAARAKRAKKLQRKAKHEAEVEETRRGTPPPAPANEPLPPAPGQSRPPMAPRGNPGGVSRPPGQEDASHLDSGSTQQSSQDQEEDEVIGESNLHPVISTGASTVPIMNSPLHLFVDLMPNASDVSKTLHHKKAGATSAKLQQPNTASSAQFISFNVAYYGASQHRMLKKVHLEHVPLDAGAATLFSLLASRVGMLQGASISFSKKTWGGGQENRHGHQNDLTTPTKQSVRASGDAGAATQHQLNTIHAERHPMLHYMVLSDEFSHTIQHHCTYNEVLSGVLSAATARSEFRVAADPDDSGSAPHVTAHSSYNPRVGTVRALLEYLKVFATDRVTGQHGILGGHILRLDIAPSVMAPSSLYPPLSIAPEGKFQSTAINSSQATGGDATQASPQAASPPLVKQAAAVAATNYLCFGEGNDTGPFASPLNLVRASAFFHNRTFFVVSHVDIQCGNYFATPFMMPIPSTLPLLIRALEHLFGEDTIAAATPAANGGASPAPGNNGSGGGGTWRVSLRTSGEAFTEVTGDPDAYESIVDRCFCYHSNGLGDAEALLPVHQAPHNQRGANHPSSTPPPPTEGTDDALPLHVKQCEDLLETESMIVKMRQQQMLNQRNGPSGRRGSKQQVSSGEDEAAASTGSANGFIPTEKLSFPIQLLLYHQGPPASTASNQSSMSQSGGNWR